MKTLTREFSVREKTLLVVLILIILGALYYLMVFQPVNDNLTRAKQDKQGLQDEITISQARAQQISDMQTELTNMEKSGHKLSSMPSYNAGKKEIDFLNETLSAETSDYYVGFTQMTREGNQIRRNFSLNFTASNFGEAKKIIESLENSEIRCLIGDMVVVPGDKEEGIMDGSVEVNCVATFYETMHGGVADSELPEDSAKEKNNTVEE